MSPLVVLLALAAACAASPSALYAPLAQPPHHPAVVLDPHGRPLDTAEVISARALHLQAKALEHAPLVHSVVAAPLAYAAPAAVYAAPAAVSHQSRVDVHSSPALYAHAAVAPLSYAHGLSHNVHYLKKRSVLGSLFGYSHAAVVAPSAVSHQSRVDVHSSPAVYAHAVTPIAHAAVYAAPAAVSHQSRVDVHASPAVVAHAVAPVAHYAAPAAVYAAPAAVYAAPAAVSHQSRVDVRSSPALYAHAAVAPVSYAHGLSHNVHGLWKRSLGHIAYAAAPSVYVGGSAVSHQSRVDAHSTPLVAHAVAPVAYAAHAVHPVAALYAAPAAVSHQSRVDVHSSPAVYAHAVHAAYASPLHFSAW